MRWTIAITTLLSLARAASAATAAAAEDAEDADRDLQNIIYLYPGTPADRPILLPVPPPTEAPMEEDDNEDDSPEVNIIYLYPGIPATDMPSDAPSLVPSDAPSMVPSDAPSMVPSDAPSMVPSDAPSMVPSSAPSGTVRRRQRFRRRLEEETVSTGSDYPSMVPSDVPSMVPSDVPSMVPSDVPSLVPSVVPTTPTAVFEIPKLDDLNEAIVDEETPEEGTTDVEEVTEEEAEEEEEEESTEVVEEEPEVDGPRDIFAPAVEEEAKPEETMTEDAAIEETEEEMTVDEAPEEEESTEETDEESDVGGPRDIFAPSIEEEEQPEEEADDKPSETDETEVTEEVETTPTEVDTSGPRDIFAPADEEEEEPVDEEEETPEVSGPRDIFAPAEEEDEPASTGNPLTVTIRPPQLTRRALSQLPWLALVNMMPTATVVYEADDDVIEYVPDTDVNKLGGIVVGSQLCLRICLLSDDCEKARYWCTEIGPSHAGSNLIVLERSAFYQVLEPAPVVQLRRTTDTGNAMMWYGRGEWDQDQKDATVQSSNVPLQVDDQVCLSYLEWMFDKACRRRNNNCRMVCHDLTAEDLDSSDPSVALFST